MSINQRRLLAITALAALLWIGIATAWGYWELQPNANYENLQKIVHIIGGQMIPMECGDDGRFTTRPNKKEIGCVSKFSIATQVTNTLVIPENVNFLVIDYDAADVQRVFVLYGPYEHLKRFNVIGWNLITTQERIKLENAGYPVLYADEKMLLRHKKPTEFFSQAQRVASLLGEHITVDDCTEKHEYATTDKAVCFDWWITHTVESQPQEDTYWVKADWGGGKMVVNLIRATSREGALEVSQPNPYANLERPGAWLIQLTRKEFLLLLEAGYKPQEWSPKDPTRG